MIGAKKYAKALIQAVGADNLEATITKLAPLAEQFNDSKFRESISSVFVPKSKKAALLADLYKDDVKLNNFLKLLGENGRLEFLPAILKELENALAAQKKQFVAILKTREKVDDKTLDSIKKALAKKINADLSIRQEVESVDGMKLSVEELGLEIAFSKTRFIEGLKEHILKAI